MEAGGAAVRSLPIKLLNPQPQFGGSDIFSLPWNQAGSSK